MAVPRPLLLALLGAVLAAVAFYATRGGAADTTSTSTPPPASPASERPLKSISPSKDGTAVGSAGDSPVSDSGSGAGRTDPSHTAAKPKPKPAATPGVPSRVGRALAKRQVVVILFRQRGGDDAATAKAVASVRGRRGVAVFTDSIDKLERYPRLVAGLGITQAPSVVVVGRSRRAALLEGYTDPGTLEQQLLDAR